MKKILTGAFLASLLLTACNIVPGLSQGEELTENFFETLKASGVEAYAMTSEGFQMNIMEEELVAFSQSPNVQGMEEITMTGVSKRASTATENQEAYSTIYVSGSVTFNDEAELEIGMESLFIDAEWAYNYDNEEWELNIFGFSQEEFLISDYNEFWDAQDAAMAAALETETALEAEEDVAEEGEEMEEGEMTEGETVDEEVMEEAEVMEDGGEVVEEVVAEEVVVEESVEESVEETVSQ